ncbi:MAG TPA: thiamine phosphate synthase [candidate division Zixibacteria bacterium]|nr:thiamine phosphate synthase [candidate division Zixibacteria bacterium]
MFPDFDLYLVTDRAQTAGRDLLWVLERALDGGARAIQLREKDLGGRDLCRLAERTLALCTRYGARLLINDRVDVALAVGADGVQLGAASMPVAAARRILGPDRLIGASTHSVEESCAVQASGADFVVFGPVHFTPSKAAFGAPQGTAALRAVVEKISLPVYAIGGIKPGNVGATKAAGCRGVALISAVMAAPDPKAATEEILGLLRAGG